MATLDERVTTLENIVKDLPTKDDMKQIVNDAVSGLATTMNDGFTGIANNQAWIVKRLARLEEKQGLEPMLGTLWQPST